jgi:hypothetical protein
MPTFVGPIYCDTAHMLFGVIHEPVNTITNAAILIAAWYAWRHIKRSGVEFSGGLIFLLVLLVSVGVGSALWHGLRTQWALILDTLPGVLFLLALTVLWIRQLYGWHIAALGLAAMGVVSWIGVWHYGHTLAAITPALRFLPFFATVIVGGALMVAGSWAKYGRGTGMLGVAILIAGTAAAFFRSIDLLVCDYLPFGTHFLWHLGLSTAACLGIFLMVRMKRGGVVRA